jgi:translation initiation factor 1 (eIF-1/SUI1)
VSRGKKAEGFEDVSIGGDPGVSVSIGDLLGVPARAAHDGGGVRDAAAEASPGVPEFIRGASQITMHRESSGRGGRTVTIVSVKPEPDSATAQSLAKLIRRGLGCGSHVEGLRVVLHGDIMDRAEAWFKKHGARRIVRGN